MFDEKTLDKNESFDHLRYLLKNRKSLRSFILYDDDQRVHYVYGQNSADVHFAVSGENKYRSTVKLIHDSPFDIVFVRTGSHGIRIEAVYRTLQRGELFRAGQILLIALLIIAVALAVALGFLTKSAPSPRRSAAVSDGFALSGRDSGKTESLIRKENGGGFCSETLLSPRLESELKRAASFDQDLALALIRAIAKKDTPLDFNHEEFYAQAAGFFPFKDLLFEYDRHTYSVILPNTDLDRGVELLNTFQHQIFEVEGCGQFELAVGLSSRNGRLIDEKRLITEASAALAKAVDDPETKLIGFRPDPGKYRSYIARSGQ